MKSSRMVRQLDYLLIFLILVLAAISIVAISGATHSFNPSYVQQQLLWYLLGILLMGATLLFDYRVLFQGRFLYVMYGLGVLLLILVMIPGVGVMVKGAQKWIRLGGFQFQPSELMKLILILVLAKVTAEIEQLPLRDWRKIGKILGLFIPPFILTLKEPDLGMALVFVGILASILLAGGLDWRIMMAGLMAVVFLIAGVAFLYATDSPLLSKILEPHQIQRIEIFANPSSDPTGAGYQLTQSMIAVGSGQLDGKGFQQGTQTQGNWIPEPHNDFIFAVLAEEFGFIGGSILLCTFIFLVYRTIRIGIHCDHRFGAYIVAGVAGMTVFQVFQNIGMNAGMLPITGLPLPFISYGGSSLITQMMAMGLVLNIGMRKEGDFLFMD
ncbi:rod shape-determining protein RodA [Kroppenstedtia guangzhouensis]|jgi:rod shape determining protein RodA|uniref:Peptidoglycan glycosyltransferase RodA n=1 Tax=Kroppenstedtia guangzhouensis TaxID=1274356 RepID=A0ABQ1G3P7_9BACL|nr:rod shape-determining protein RodA [Kroppenstedtia guangzhouensis]GGA36064.1 rod shape-determining protein RodA [Kroppenstedtia guangzhouensis]